VSDDVGTAGPNIASLAAHQARRACQQPGAPPELLADVACVAEILTAIGASHPPAGDDGADTALRLARLSDHHEQLARLSELMTRIEAGSPDSAGYWRVIASTQRDMAAQMLHAALLAAEAQIS
jgi:hypothetical protein